MTKTDLIKDFAEAIARYEGFYRTRSKAARNNNPGNLRSWGNTPVVKNMAVFPTEALGWRALKLQIHKNIGRGLTTFTFFAGQRDEKGEVIRGGYPGYAPAKDGNDPVAYSNFVSARIGIPVDVPLNTCYE